LVLIMVVIVRVSNRRLRHAQPAAAILTASFGVP
jgi:hypothetical protein